MKAKSYFMWAIVLFVVVALVVMFIIAVNQLGLWERNDFLRQIVGVLFGSFLLLFGTVAVMGFQIWANIVEERKKTAFDEKIAVYHDFLSDLETIIRDKKINENKEYELQIKLSYLSLQIKEPENMMKISRSISDIVTKIKNEHNEDKGIMIELMEITDVMYMELYGENIKTHSKEQTLEDIRDEMVLDFYSINVSPEDITSYRYVVKRIREIKKLITRKKDNNDVVYDRQWVYNGYTLVHDLYTDRDKRSKQFVCNERSNKYTVDIKFNTKGDTVSVELFSRKNSKEETDKLLKELQTKKLKPIYFKKYQKEGINSIMENGHYEYAQWNSRRMENDSIVNELVELLNAIDQCRERE